MICLCGLSDSGRLISKNEIIVKINSKDLPRINKYVKSINYDFNVKLNDSATTNNEVINDK